MCIDVKSQYLFYILKNSCPRSLGTLQLITHCHTAKTMASYCKVKSTIVIEESPIMKDPKLVIVSAVPKGTSTNAKKRPVWKSTLATNNMKSRLIANIPDCVHSKHQLHVFVCRDGTSLQTLCSSWKHPSFNKLERGMTKGNRWHQERQDLCIYHEGI